MCVTGCRGFKRNVLKGSEPAAVDKVAFFLHVGPLPVTNEQKGEDEKLTFNRLIMGYLMDSVRAHGIFMHVLLTNRRSEMSEKGTTPGSM